MVHTVAVGTDGSGTADKAVEFAIELAARYEAGIVFISAYVPGRESHAGPPVDPSASVEATLRACEERAQQKGLHWASAARAGDPAKVLVELAASNDADLLVIGNKGMNRRTPESVPDTVTHTSPCSVMIVKTT
jgi:nucleotide-binding universal stress UspA family protein